jgi:hypothetical protein
MAVVEDVTVVPVASSRVTTGCVVKYAPDTPANGWVVKTICVTGPVMLKLALVVDAKPLAVACNVRFVPVRLPPQPENEAAPPEAFTGLVVHDSVPLLMDNFTETLDVVTMLPNESSTVTTGCTTKGVAGFTLATPVGWVVKTG